MAMLIVPPAAGQLDAEWLADLRAFVVREHAAISSSVECILQVLDAAIAQANIAANRVPE